MSKNDNKAEFEACWAGDFVYMCENHMKQLIAIGSAMGVPVSYKPYSGEEKCKNCIRERGEGKNNG